MRPLTEAEVRASFVNADAEELRTMEMPHDFLLVDWDYLDFFAWQDPSASRRGYILIPHEDRVVGIVLRATEPGRGRSGMCNICHTMQPGNQIALLGASCRRGGAARRLLRHLPLRRPVVPRERALGASARPERGQDSGAGRPPSRRHAPPDGEVRLAGLGAALIADTLDPHVLCSKEKP